MNRQKKSLYHNVTGMECGGDAKGLAGLSCVAAEVPEGNFRAGGLPLRSVGSKPQARLPTLQHQSQKGTQITSSCEKWQGFSLPGRDG